MAERTKVQAKSITSLLAELGNGNQSVENELADLIYGELRRVASAHMRRERGGHTLQATALTNEAWLRLAAQHGTAWQNRAHFLAVASRMMRQILVDHARRRLAGKRGYGQQITVTDGLAAKSEDRADLLALDQALDRLRSFDPRASRIVELHFFGGLSFDEMALVLDISARTAKRDWSMAQAWLQSQLAKQA